MLTARANSAFGLRGPATRGHPYACIAREWDDAAVCTQLWRSAPAKVVGCRIVWHQHAQARLVEGAECIEDIAVRAGTDTGAQSLETCGVLGDAVESEAHRGSHPRVCRLSDKDPSQRVDRAGSGRTDAAERERDGDIAARWSMPQGDRRRRSRMRRCPNNRRRAGVRASERRGRALRRLLPETRRRCPGSSPYSEPARWRRSARRVRAPLRRQRAPRPRARTDAMDQCSRPARA